MATHQVHYIEHGDVRPDFGPHVFPVEKYALLSRLLRTELGVEEARIQGAEQVTDEDLLRVHTREYVADLRAARTTPATAMSELPVERSVIDAFLAMTGGSVTALRVALELGIGFHIGGGFHHAFADHAEGFCYVNDTAIAIEKLRAETGLEQVLVLDVDVHQGNGTAAIYAGSDTTFTYSIHQENNYPIKEESDLDRGLGDGVGDERYLELLQQDLAAIETRFSPKLVCYLAGVDPYRFDQLGGLELTREGLERRDRLVLRHCADRGWPLAVFLAGGYARSPEETAGLHLGTARAAESVTAS